jgi:hypothetical protein
MLYSTDRILVTLLSAHSGRPLKWMVATAHAPLPAFPWQSDSFQLGWKAEAQWSADQRSRC